MPEVLLVNLRVISKLQPGDRLQCNDSKYFGIDRGWGSWFWRWLKSDTRQVTLERLEETTVAAIARINEPCMQQLLKDACTGLGHLLETYRSDPTTVSRIETVILNCNVKDPTPNNVEEEQAL